MDEIRCPQVVVGVSGSLASLQALRYGVAEARRRRAGLTVLHAYRPGACSDPAVLDALRESELRAAQQRLRRWLDDGLGGPPTDLPLRQIVVPGPAGAALVGHAGGEHDLLVIGASRRRPVARWSGRVGSYCTTRASCPVVVVPPSRLARELGGRNRQRLRRIERQLSQESRRVP
jgi:nucleotide-binding universal stress UspA family protein